MALYSFATFLFFAAVLAISIAKPLENGGKHWALIVAGSNGYYNYRHQADVCHAYHVFKNHGIPEENIILMMYDDIASNFENPDKGVIINRPGGENVYKGVKKDYINQDVTPEVFLAVLQGQKVKVAGRGTGRVIESGPNDHVFVNFVDHGAPGLVSFPTSVLYATDFMTALTSMHKEGRYAQMVIYVESCESGSMFQGLLSDDMNIYATTAANAKESSYATYYDSHLQTFLGDLYSVKWMENSDVANLNTEPLESQFEITKKETNMSHVQEYGDLSIAKEPVGDFQGNTGSARNIYYPNIPFDAVPSHDVDLHILHRKIEESTSVEDRRNLTVQLDQAFKHRDEVSTEMKHIISVALNHDHLMVADAISLRTENINFDCYVPAVNNYFRFCRKLNEEPFAMRMLYALQNVCNVEEMKSETLINAMYKIC